MENSSSIPSFIFKIENLNFEGKAIQDIEIGIILYSNRVFIIITQMNKLGNIVSYYFQNKKKAI
jgi:hypothetical protein